MLPDPGRPRELPDGDPVGLAGDWRVVARRFSQMADYETVPRQAR